MFASCVLRPGHHLSGRPLRVHHRVAGAAVGPHQAGQVRHTHTQAETRHQNAAGREKINTLLLVCPFADSILNHSSWVNCCLASSW